MNCYLWFLMKYRVYVFDNLRAIIGSLLVLFNRPNLTECYALLVDVDPLQRRQMERLLQIGGRVSH